MKIGICTPSILYPEGGVGTYMRNLLDGLAGIDIENQYLIFGNAQSFSQLNLRANIFNKMERGVFTRVRGLRIMWEHTLFPLECSLHGVDVIHSMLFVTPVFNLRKSVVTIYDMGFYLYPQYHEKKKVQYFRQMIPQSVARADLILTISESVKQELCNHFGITETKVRVTHLAHNNVFRVLDAQTEVEEAKKRWEIYSPYLLFVGTMEPRKNLPRLLDAFKVYKENHPDHCQLVIVGRHGWGDELERTIADKGLERDVKLTGVVPLNDLVRVYNGARALIYPSLYEGFGIPVLEAMACGIPVITSDCCAMKEVAGESALLVSPESTEEILYAIERVMSDDELCKDLRQKGLKHAKTFSWARTAAQTLQAYQDVCA